MRKLILNLFLLVVFAGVGIILSQKYPQPFTFKLEYSLCDEPIYYKIGQIDKEFGLSKDKLLAFTNQAGDIWNEKANRRLFVYRENGGERDLTIDLKFDKRQALKTKLDNLEGQVYKSDEELKQAIESFEGQVKDFNLRMAEFNSEILNWNEKGGAPQDVYRELQKKQEAFVEETKSLNKKNNDLSGAVKNFNLQVGVLNETIKDINIELSVRPEEGLFDPNSNRIEIFFYSRQDELVHTLAHEFGHARGLNHVNGEKSIMYPFTTKILIPSDEDAGQLTEICRKRSVAEDIKLIIVKWMSGNYELRIPKWML